MNKIINLAKAKNENGGQIAATKKGWPAMAIPSK